MASSGDVVEATPEPGVDVQPASDASDGGSSLPEEHRAAVLVPQMTADHHEAATAKKEEEEEEEEKKAEAPGDALADSARERLRRHRREMAGRVWVPEMWGQEKLLKDWVDCAVFDRPLVPAGLLTARRALVAECCARRPARTQQQAGSSPLRVLNGFS